MIKFPSIDQFRHVVRNIRKISNTMPTLHYIGTVKLHGTNASVVVIGDNVQYQSRNNVISVESDNAGFAAFAEEVGKDYWRQYNVLGNEVVIYGEWCGGNIRKGVAICDLEKMFVVFKIKVDGGWLSKEEMEPYFRDASSEIFRVYNIFMFPYFELDIDFLKPEQSQNILAQLTQQVENECPVAKYFGISGTGEGIVWTCYDPEYNHSDFFFKTKGQKHSASKVKKIANIDIEKVNSLNEFVDKVVTESRLLQGVDYLVEQEYDIDQKSTSVFLKWLYNDIIKEEQDTLEESGLDQKEIGAYISRSGKDWWFNFLDGLNK